MAGMKQVSFTVPAGSGDYATAILYLNSVGDASRIACAEPVNELTVVVGTIVATAAIELDFLKPNGDPAVAGDWLLAAKSYTEAGVATYSEFAGWRGVRIRVKSGGTGGTQVVSAFWR